MNHISHDNNVYKHLDFEVYDLPHSWTLDTVLVGIRVLLLQRNSD